MGATSLPLCPDLRCRRPRRLLGAMCFAICLAVGCRQEKPAVAPAPVVAVAAVIVEDVPIIHEWVGTADGFLNAKINALVTGYLIRQNYQEGSLVKKGQVLFEIASRPFQAVLEQAKGELAIAEGQLYTAKANLAKIRPLAAVNAVNKKDLDDAIGREASARAAVQAAKAAVQKAQIDLSFTKITSPIDGIAGIAKAQIGDLVGKPGGPELTTVSTEICTLLGRNPGPIKRGKPLLKQDLSVSVPPSLPASLLERRPDIRYAEEQLVAANARIGEAKALLFPNIRLTGVAGWESAALKTLFSAPASFWDLLSPGVLQPIFTAGRLRAGVRATEAQQQAALLA